VQDYRTSEVNPWTKKSQIVGRMAGEFPRCSGRSSCFCFEHTETPKRQEEGNSKGGSKTSPVHRKRKQKTRLLSPPQKLARRKGDRHHFSTKIKTWFQSLLWAGQSQGKHKEGWRLHPSCHSPSHLGCSLAVFIHLRTQACKLTAMPSGVL